MRRAPFILALALLAASAPVAAEIPYSYAVTFQTVRPLLLPLTDDDMEPGSFAVRLGMNWSNVWSAQLNRFHIDGEELSVEPRIRYQTSERGQLSFQTSFKVLGGGSMDHSIDVFHRSVGVADQQRSRYPRNRLNVSYEPLGPMYPWLDQDWLRTKLREVNLRAYPRRPYSPPIPGNGPFGTDPFGLVESRPLSGSTISAGGDPIATYSHTLLVQQDWFPRLVGGLLVKFPGAGVAPASSAGRDVGLFTAIDGPLGAGFAYRVGVSHAWLENRDYYVLRLPKTQWVYRVGLSKTLPDRWRMLVEYVTFSRPVDDFGRLSERGHEFGFGVEKAFEDGRLVIGAVENFLTYSVTPDFALHASYEIRR